MHGLLTFLPFMVLVLSIVLVVIVTWPVRLDIDFAELKHNDMIIPSLQTKLQCISM